ncbi:PD-(D/E)XK nuclease family protein [Aristophania vespae]|uniref:PD-(D/E)XK nuclease family protein n=1 Tax=Aristophania vespae TaxID=2697033 RepID=UPI00210FB944|nr:PD-(D/E)XK nuclease family protein [Aristophania vespae]
MDVFDHNDEGTHFAQIFDYKTGALPEIKNVRQGWSSQLILEAALLAEGAFKGLNPARIKELTYWKLSGAAQSGEVRHLLSLDKKPEHQDIIDQALDNVRHLLHDYDQPDRAYLSRPRIGYAPQYSNYTQLARVDEWFYNSGDE